VAIARSGQTFVRGTNNAIEMELPDKDGLFKHCDQEAVPT
jgi:hypothetical protein